MLHSVTLLFCQILFEIDIKHFIHHNLYTHILLQFYTFQIIENEVKLIITT